MKELFLSLILLLLACKENESETDSFLKFKLSVDGIEYNQTWSNMTESSTQIYMEATDSISQFGVVFSKGHNYTDPKCELNYENKSFKPRSGSFSIQSNESNGVFTGNFSGTLFSDSDSVKITDGIFIWKK